MADTYQCIALDPNWPERGGGGRGANVHYGLQSIVEIGETIRRSPLWRPNRDGCHVWMWTLGRYLVTGEAQYLFARLKVRPVKVFPWVKTGRVTGFDDELSDDELQMSLGQYGRAAHEYILFGVIGTLPQLETGRAEPDVIVAPVPRDSNGKRIHSRKPREAYAKIELISPGPRAELYARSPRRGWDVWGDEADKFAEVAP